jgi:hypothetical protein
MESRQNEIFVFYYNNKIVDLDDVDILFSHPTSLVGSKKCYDSSTLNEGLVVNLHKSIY